MRSLLLGAGKSPLLTACLAGAVLVIIGIAAAPANAADKDLTRTTLLFFSIDDMAGYRKAERLDLTSDHVKANDPGISRLSAIRSLKPDFHSSAAGL